MGEIYNLIVIFLKELSSATLATKHMHVYTHMRKNRGIQCVYYLVFIWSHLYILMDANIKVLVSMQLRTNCFGIQIIDKNPKGESVKTVDP